MKNLCLFLVAFTTTNAVFAQHLLEPINGHYKTLQALNPKPNTSRLGLDSLKFPPTEYGNSIIYLLVKPYYLTELQVKSLTKLAQPPANSSEQVRQELDYLLDLQNKRTPEQVKRVTFLGDIGYWPSVDLLKSNKDYETNLKHLFFEGQEVFGDSINARNFPQIAQLLRGIMRDMRIMEFTVKYEYVRPRPYHLETKLNALARMGSPAFASGHTLWAFLHAFVWSEIIPEKRSKFIELAEELRQSREIMGIHYPSDNEAARQIAYKMVQFYFKNNQFKTDLAVAKAEWKTLSPLFIK